MHPAHADYAEARAHFDRMRPDDQVAMTLGLIATGDYVGLLDFGFTRRYYGAVLGFERREGLTPDGMLDAAETQRLENRANGFYAGLGLKFFTHPTAGSRLFVPRGLFDAENRTDHGYAFERSDKNLSLSFVAYDNREKSFPELFETLSRDTARRRIDYKRIRNSYFVVSGSYRGREFYTWMSAIPGSTTGFTLSWSEQWSAVGSKLSILLANAFAPVPRSAPPPEATAPSGAAATAVSPAPSPPPPQSGTGTGFAITGEGHVLTNFHVAGRCASLTLRKTGQLPVAAELVAGDSTNDLALIKARGTLTGSVASFADGAPPRAGSEIAVFGFPLASVLSDSGNIVTGNITSLAGLGNDSRLFQISAPVQPGNSGGPVVDRQGHVVAVVVSKLDAMLTAEKIGDIPQNVNFAIKANVAMNFLDGAGIAYQRSGSGPQLDTPSIADTAQGFTFLIECRN